MTNNPTIDGVSRELLERFEKALLQVGRQDHLCDYSLVFEVKKELRALLDASVVERQPEEGAEHPKFIEFAICDTCAAESLCCEVAPNEHLCGGCYWAPINEKAHVDEVAVLQSTITQLQARITQLESEAMYAAAGYQAARDRITELERARGEPVANCFERRNGAGEWVNDSKTWADGMPCAGILNECEKYPDLYRIRLAYDAPPAPVAVVLPDRKPVTVGLLSESNTHNQGWNSCLDATAALNGERKPTEWHDVAGDDEGLAR